ncbi:MAG: hypothetical protein U0T80_06955 [Flavobacteriaceae bacterium]
MNSNITGYENISIGYITNLLVLRHQGITAVEVAMVSNTSGWINTAVGNGSLHDITTGMANVANGSVSLYTHAAGSYNVGDGSTKLYSNTLVQKYTTVQMPYNPTLQVIIQFRYEALFDINEVIM